MDEKDAKQMLFGHQISRFKFHNPLRKEMKMKTTIAATAILLGLVAGASAASQVDAVQPIPGTGMQMVETQGKTFFMSANGRYVIQGALMDVWSGKEIKTTRDLAQSASKVDMSKVGPNLDEMLALTYGAGPKEVLVFVAPGCPYCSRTMAQMAGLEKEYTFKLVPLPILGEASQRQVAELACNAEKYPAEATRALLSESYGNLPIKSVECDMERLAKSTVVSQIIGIRSVPVIVAPDGRVQTGAPSSLAGFLQGS